MTTQTKLIRKEELRFKKVVTGDPGKDLRQRTKSFALRIVRMFSALPKTTEAQILGKQVLAFRDVGGSKLSGGFPSAQ